MSPCRTILLLFLTAGASAASPLQADDRSLTIAARHQTRARSLVERLVSGLIDQQQQQLAENGLERTELAQELNALRTTLIELTTDEMQQIDRLLQTARTLPPAERTDQLNTVRTISQQIVEIVRSEQTKVRIRLALSQANLAVDRLLSLQRENLRLTAELQTMSLRKRTTRLKQVLDTQRGITRLADHSAVQLASEPLTTAAGLSAQAVRELRAEEFSTAATTQTAIRELLEKLKATLDAERGLSELEGLSQRQTVREIARRQQRLQDTTQLASFDTDSARQIFSEQQGLIIRQLEQVSEQAPQQAADRLLPARRAAQRAKTAILAGNKPEAISEQGLVIAHLEEVLRSSQQAASRQPADSEDWQQLQADLEEALKLQDRAVEKAEQAPKEAALLEAAVLERLERMSQQPLPDALKKQLQQAMQEVQQAAEQLRQPGQNLTDAQKSQLNKAQQALRDLAARMRQSEEREAGANQAQENGSAGRRARSATSSGSQAGESSEDDSVSRTNSRGMSADSDEQREPDVRTDRRRFRQAPWFARLPESARAAIEANRRSNPPSLYEERLRAFFQSSDNPPRPGSLDPPDAAD